MIDSQRGNKSEGAAFKGRSRRFQGSKVPAPWGEGAGSVGLGDDSQGFWRCLLYPLKDAVRDP